MDALEPSTPPRASLGRRFARGAFWSLVGTAVGQACQMAGSIVTARVLGADPYGQLGIVMSTAGAFGVLASFGMGLTATRFVSQHRDGDPDRAGRVLGLALLATAVAASVAAFAMLLSSPLLAEKSLHAPHLAGELRVACLSLLLSAIAGTLTGGLTGLEAFRAVAAVSLAQAVVGLPLRIAGAVWFGVSGAVWALAATPAIAVVLSAIALGRACRARSVRVRLRGLAAEMPVVWRFSLPALLSGALTMPAQWLANTILVRLPDGYTELGVLNAATQWRTLLVFLPTVLASVALPLMSAGLSDAREDDGDASRDYARTFEMTQGLSILVVFPLGTLAAFLTQPILALYGRTYENGDVMLIGTVATAMAATVGVAVATAVQARGRMWLGFSTSLSWSVLLVLATLLGAERWGGASIAFGGALAHVQAGVWPFVMLRGGFGPATTLRLLGQMAVCILVPVAALLTPAPDRLWLALPAALAVAGASWGLLCAPEVRTHALGLLRERTIRASAGGA